MDSSHQGSGNRLVSNSVRTSRCVRGVGRWEHVRALYHELGPFTMALLVSRPVESDPLVHLTLRFHSIDPLELAFHLRRHTTSESG